MVFAAESEKLSTFFSGPIPSGLFFAMYGRRILFETKLKVHMPSEAIFHPSTGSVQFAIYPDGYDGARIIARIDEEALHARFHAPREDSALIRAYAENADSIDAMATARYRANPAAAICLHSEDF